MEKRPADVDRPANGSVEDRLDSWKEIAQYLKREVRTVQRWEKRDGLPIHRLQHDKLGSIYAFKSELETWMAQRDPWLERDDQESLEVTPSDDPPSTHSDQIIPGREEGRRSHLRTWLRVLFVVGALALAGVGGYLLRPHSVKSTRASSNKVYLVVLPFRNLSGDPSQDNFIRGLTDEMTTRLGTLDPDGLGVIANTTAGQLQGKSLAEIAASLHVDYVLEGSVSRSHDHVRVDTQLVQVSDQTERWAHSYERNMKDILVLQSDIATSVAQEIALAIKPEERQRLASVSLVDPEAYDSYLQGLSYWNRRTPVDLMSSLHLFQKAISEDSRFAAAYAGLSSAYSLLSQIPNDVTPPREAMPKAKAAAEQALKIDPDSAEGHVAMALVLQSYDWNWEGAEREYQRAIHINPSYATARQWHSLLLTALGKRNEALNEIRLAEQTDPLSLIIRASRVQALYFDHQYDHVIEICQQTLQIAPSFYYMDYHLGRAYVQKGMFPQAITVFQEMEHLIGKRPLAIAALGNAYAVAGNRPQALAALQELSEIARTQYVPAVYFAAVYAGLGDKDHAFHWLDKALEERDDYLINLNVDPMADPLRSDPRFQRLLRRIGLPQ